MKYPVSTIGRLMHMESERKIMMAQNEIKWHRVFIGHDSKKYIPNGYYYTPLLVKKGITEPYLRDQAVCTKPTSFRQIILEEKGDN